MFQLNSNASFNPFSLQESNELCDKKAYVGMKKDAKNVVTDLSGNVISPMNWSQNQPNGGDLQLCVDLLAGTSRYNDADCDTPQCFACPIPTKNEYYFRGILPFETERNYFVSMTGKQTEIRGFKETICSWNETWQFGSNLKEDDSNEVKTNVFPPVGLKKWNNGTFLKFTQCNETEFTCHTYGHCISLYKRCDTIPDCPIDAADEQGCKIMTYQVLHN